MKISIQFSFSSLSIRFSEMLSHLEWSHFSSSPRTKASTWRLLAASSTKKREDKKLQFIENVKKNNCKDEGDKHKKWPHLNESFLNGPEMNGRVCGEPSSIRSGDVRFGSFPYLIFQFDILKFIYLSCLYSNSRNHFCAYYLWSN